MKKLIEISPDLAIMPHRVSAVKRFDDEKCTVFMAADCAVDGGFLIEREFDAVLEEINDALEGEDDDEA